MDARSSSSPLLAFGHLFPYLELAERLASRGHRVSYASTPRNLARLPPLRPATAPRVDLVALLLPRVEGLPEGAESTHDFPDEMRELFFEAFDGLAAPFTEFLASACADEATRPHWIVADAFHHWAAAAALDHKEASRLQKGQVQRARLENFEKNPTSRSWALGAQLAPRRAHGRTAFYDHVEFYFMMSGGGDRKPRNRESTFYRQRNIGRGFTAKIAFDCLSFYINFSTFFSTMRGE